MSYQFLEDSNISDRFCSYKVYPNFINFNNFNINDSYYIKIYKRNLLVNPQMNLSTNLSTSASYSPIIHSNKVEVPPSFVMLPKLENITLDTNGLPFILIK
jgi:hypothetical protein